MPCGLAAFAMPLAGVRGREEPVTEKTLPHHVFSAAHVLGYPFQVLPRAQSEFKLNMIQEVKSVTVKDVKTSAGRLYQIIQLLLLHSRCCFWPPSFQSAPM
jgi:hypothetical protein